MNLKSVQRPLDFSQTNYHLRDFLVFSIPYFILSESNSSVKTSSADNDFSPLRRYIFKRRNRPYASKEVFRYFFKTYFVVILTKTYTSLVHLFPFIRYVRFYLNFVLLVFFCFRLVLRQFRFRSLLFKLSSGLFLCLCPHWFLPRCLALIA